jgi:Tol biopolymer transport system component
MNGRLLLSFSIAALVAASCERSLPVSADPLVLQLAASKRSNSMWSEPVNLGPPINSAFDDNAPALSPDGLSLYFASTRPGGLGNPDIWVSHRASVDGPWEAPVNLGAPINTSAVESGPNLSEDGRMLFFQSSRDGGQGSNDIYVAHRTQTGDDLAWGDPINLGPNVNSSSGEFGPWFQRHDDQGPMLYFARGPVNTFTDIYAAPITRDGEASGPAHLVTELTDLNFNDARPTMTANGKRIIFFSNRPGSLGGVDLWESTRRTVHDAWSEPVNLGPTLNSTYNDLLPFLTRNGHTLLFTSTRPGFGGFDIWISTRSTGADESDEP